MSGTHTKKDETGKCGGLSRQPKGTPPIARHPARIARSLAGQGLVIPNLIDSYL